jgi:regulator of sigma E protease
MILSIMAVVLTFGLVIFLHEAGHFLVCRRLGVRVQRFAFGFGPELIGVTHNGTRFSICAIPLGGFVKPAGESLEDCTGQPDEYFSKNPWERLLIVAAGPVMNYGLAFLMFFAVVYHRGVPEPSPEAIIGETAPGFPADKAGLKSGDRILQVGDTDVTQWSQMASLIHKTPGQSVELIYMRGEERRKTQVIPQKDTNSGRGLIGILPKIEYRAVGMLGASQEGLRQCWYWTSYTVKTLAEKIYKRERPDLAGPVGIVQMVSRAAHSGAEDLIFLIGLISVAIGFFNLLPIPLLDGGHAVLYLWEGISHRKLTTKAIAVVNSIGLAFLMSLLLFATYNDIIRIRESRRAEKTAAAQAQ